MGLEVASPASAAEAMDWARFATMTASITPSIPTLKTMRSGYATASFAASEKITAYPSTTGL